LLPDLALAMWFTFRHGPRVLGSSSKAGPPLWGFSSPSHEAISPISFNGSYPLQARSCSIFISLPWIREPGTPTAPPANFLSSPPNSYPQTTKKKMDKKRLRELLKGIELPGAPSPHGDHLS